MPKFRKWFKRFQSSLTKSSSNRSRLNSTASSSVRTDSDATTTSSSSTTSSTKSDDYHQTLLPNIIEIEPTKVLYEFDQLDVSRWENSVAIVVGASAGVGSAICTALVKRGIIVIGCSRTDALVNALAEECEERKFKGKLHPYKCALMNEHDVKDLFTWVHKKFGRIDILINNPELINDKAVKRYTEERLRELVHRKILILVLCTKEAANYMTENGTDRQGHIFNICSTIDQLAKEYGKAMVSASPNTNKRVSSKGGLRDLEKSKIRVTAISPGKSEADLFRRVYGQQYVDETPSSLSSSSYFSGHDVANALLYSLSCVR